MSWLIASAAKSNHARSSIDQIDVAGGSIVTVMKVFTNLYTISALRKLPRQPSGTIEVIVHDL